MIDEAQKKFLEKDGWDNAPEGWPKERDVIHLSRELYYSEVLKSDKLWIITFVKKNKSQPQFWQSEFAYFATKILADEFEGQVRFGYADIHSEETLKETFGVITVPQSFFIFNGTAVEMPSMFMAYE